MRFPALLIILTSNLLAHTDISTTIRTLSARIKKDPTAELFYQRATEYRALREKAHAIEDLRAALEIAPSHRPSRIALIKVLGSTDEALRLARELVAESGNHQTAIEPSCLVARILQKRGELREALLVCQQLDRLTVGRDPEIDLLHADILLALDRPGDAANSLKVAWQRTNSIVLRNNWIDTALTAGRTDEVLPMIEKELRSSRLRSSWYLRRARALFIHNKKEEARADLHAALAEIESRINPAQPDLTLIADRGFIHALMGHRALAKQDLATLHQSTLPSSSYRLLSTELDKEH